MSKTTAFSLLLASCLSFNLTAADNKTLNNKQTPQKQSSPAFDAFTGKIVGSRVRMRAGPDLDSAIIQEFTKEDLIIVKGEENGFYSIETPKGIKGYVFRSYILDNIVEANKVNIRLEPALDAPIVGQLLSGQHIEGTISKINPKWLEIELPKTTRFFVAKEYVQSVGKPELLETLQKRKNDVNSLLNNAYTFSQNEMRKPFDLIQIGLIQNQFQNIIKNYTDFPEQVTKAKETLQLIQETYLQNKIVYLESKNKECSESYKQQLATLENRLAQDLGTTPFTQAEEEAFMRPTTNLDAIKRWEPIEEHLYTQWLTKNPGKSKKDFYQEELSSAVILKGVLEPYNSAVKNRPGDYLLKVNNLPVAFVYSTCVNLSEKSGQTVSITALKRPNNHFAYPAYFVISIQ
ncbi:MAG: SH3 domain-containing protein [Chlamydiales bacterium]|nr:SH3 domain-containing protein [Chlamydiales bacterium]